MRRLVIAAVGLTAGVGVSTEVRAQYVDSVWPGFRGTATKRGAVEAPGPAVSYALTIGGLDMVSPGGISVDDDGDLYFKSYDTGVSESFVYRIDPSDGTVLATSPGMVSASGNYSGVSIGVDAIYCSNYAGEGNTSIFKLDKDTLDIIDEFTDASFLGLRGAPLISAIPNDAGHQMLYVGDRNGIKIHAVDAVTGEVMWSYATIADTPFWNNGPMWETDDGRQAFAYFGNVDEGGGAALADNGDGTFEVLWEFAGPDSFHWWGLGSLSADGQRIYVTTFNDNNADSFWVIDRDTGDIIDSFDGMVDEGPLNFFGRPAVVDNRIYCGGGDGVLACYEDDGTGNISLVWAYRDHVDEHTCTSAVKTPEGDVYIYTARQNIPALLMFRDAGDDYEMILETDLDGDMRNSLFANSSLTIDADGNLWMGGGNPNDDAGMSGDVYKFTALCDCSADINADCELNVLDFVAFQLLWQAADSAADCNGDGFFDTLDFICFQELFQQGCN